MTSLIKKINFENAIVTVFKDQIVLGGINLDQGDRVYEEGFLYAIAYKSGSTNQSFKTKELTDDEIEHLVYMCDY